MGVSIFDEVKPYIVSGALAADNVGGQLVCFDTNNGPSRLDAVVLTTDSTVDMECSFQVTDHSGHRISLQRFTLPALSGLEGVPAVDVLALLTTPLRSGFPLDLGSAAWIQLETAGDSLKQIVGTGFGGLL